MAKIAVPASARGKWVVVVTVALFGFLIWLAFTTKDTWGTLLGEFSFGGTLSGSRGRSQRIAMADMPKLRPEDLSRVTLVDLPYLGDGEAKLGHFDVKLYDMPSRTTFRVEFELQGKTTLGDAETFQDYMDANYRFLREQVGIAVRTCDPNDLIAADHEILGRKLVCRINRSLGAKVLQNVVFKDFQLSESTDGFGFVPCEMATEGM